MGFTTAALRSAIGSTNYFVATLTIRELLAWARPPSSTDSWVNGSIDLQNNLRIDTKSIRRNLMPYFARCADRFAGAVLLVAPTGALTFRSLNEEGSGKFGQLTVEHGPLVALDGQHRLLAFREVITGGTELGEYAHKVGDDEVCVLFIEFETPEKTRRIFNKVNRHAKPTGRSDNIITSEDDGNAIVARWLLDTDRGAPLAERDNNGTKTELVSWKSNTLGQNSTHLTTISTVYEAVRDILASQGFEGFDEQKNPVAPPDTELERAYEVAAEWWTRILGLDAFANALADTSQVPNIRYDPDHPHSLLLRPVGQNAFVKGLILALKRADGALDLTEALRRANKINWASPAGSIWTNTIVAADGRKMVVRKDAQELAANLIAYLIGDQYMTQAERDDLYHTWNTARGKDTDTPIDQLGDPSLTPEDLPEPVRP